jgi:hypothetical protein
MKNAVNVRVLDGARGFAICATLQRGSLRRAGPASTDCLPPQISC